ncbi:MAG TPA: DUF192 domain-containing protein [Tepidisphaeraceae bacterium]|nr:DUF192 domain-containing protein [Tepidisphaeraceae bacterium]
MFRLKLPMVLLIALVGGCAERGRNSALATVEMRIGSETYTLEIANSEAKRKRGLMERDSMPADHGMIFVFDEEQELNFWMKNTRFPLEILYLDAGGQVVSIRAMKPYDTRTNHSSARPAKYAIELNVGQVKKSGVKVGDVLEIPASARKAVD